MKYSLDFRASELGPASRVEFPDFSPETWSLIEDFMSFSGDAHSTRFARELSSYKTSFQFLNSGRIRNVGTLPDDEAFSTFLHKYRPIVLKKERTEFTKICSVLVKQISHPLFTQVVKAWKEEFSGKSLRKLFTLTQGNIDLIGQSFLETYLNAFEYHRDEGKRTSLSEFTSSFDPDARKGVVTILLIHKFSAVSRIREFICEIKRLKKK